MSSVLFQWNVTEPKDILDILDFDDTSTSCESDYEDSFYFTDSNSDDNSDKVDNADIGNVRDVLLVDMHANDCVPLELISGESESDDKIKGD